MRVLILSVALLALGASGRPEPPVNQYLPPDQLYGAPPTTQQRPPSPGRPGSIGSGGNFGVNQYLPPNQQYGPPGSAGGGGFGGGGGGGFGGGYGGYDDGSNAPAKYEFEYMVNDPPSGNDFGHRESRDGDLTRGVYYVLLPDGRRQMVEYEADQNGYRPKITYMQEGSGYPGSGGGLAGGYPGGGNAGYRY